jgi:hypothetical protein
MKLIRKIRNIFYKVCGSLLFEIKARKRLKIHQLKKEKSKLEIAFRKLESNLLNIDYPNNGFNKIMSMLLSDIELFEHVTNRFREDRHILSFISQEDQFLHFLGPNKRSYPSHPFESINNRAIKIDVQSLFIFSMIMINRSLILLRMYLSDENADQDMYKKIGNLYWGLVNSKNLSDATQKFKDKFIEQIKWLYAALRFYRNEFIEHLDKGYQQGMNFGVWGNDFTLSSYKWDYNDSDDNKVEALRAKLESRGIKIPERSSGSRALINRYYIQKLFDNIILVPNDLLKESLDLIEDIGVHSPQPEEVISNVENYIEGVLDFMSNEFKSSELIKYKKNS